jgi:hypothetical protein
VAPPPPPPITLSLRVIEEASAYRAYMARASAISPAFADGEAIAQSLKIGAAYEPRRFLRGAVGYAAVVALQDPTFVASLREVANDPAQRREMANQLVANPAYVVSVKGSDRAAGLVTRALRADSLRLFTAGRAVKQAAYDIQHQEWSKAHVADQQGRLMLAKTLSSTPGQGFAADAEMLRQASIGAIPLGLTADPKQPPYTPLVIRGLAVAALAALGEGGEEHAAQLDSLLNDPTTSYCLGMAKLNLYQCLAVSKPHYEDVFCLGQHIMMDTGQCLMKGSGAPLPLQIATLPLTLPAPTGKVKYVAQYPVKPPAAPAPKKKKK